MLEQEYQWKHMMTFGCMDLNMQATKAKEIWKRIGELATRWVYWEELAGKASTGVLFFIECC